MKKSTIPPILLTGLLVLSLSSYVYLQHAASNNVDFALTRTEITETEQGPLRQSGILCPDISLVKRIVNITKIVMPKD